MKGRWLVSWIGRPFHGTARAKRELAGSEADVPRVTKLAADLRRIERENHITERVHRAMRGES